MPARQFDGTRVRAERRANDLTQKQLANLIGLRSHAPVAAWEAGKSFPDGDKLPAIAGALGKDIDELFPRDGAPDLKDLREDAGFPQNRTGQLIGVESHIPVSNAERGIRRLDAKYVPLLAEAYQVSVKELRAAEDRSFGLLVPLHNAPAHHAPAVDQPETLAAKLQYLDQHAFPHGQAAPTDDELAAIINRHAGADIAEAADIAALRSGSVTVTTPALREGLGEAYGVSPLFFQPNDEVAQQVLEGISLLAARERGDVLALAARGNENGLSGAMLAKVNALITDLSRVKDTRRGK
ncbi:helix-turn-helix transcriptional regulator [Streptomyces sp. NPDC006367]|uniref:helix-turn-helix domain-containing protein n=1 Tax=unclassified Streptomyces TaxID=2593676 RepID=UPI0033B44FB9